MEMKLLTVKKTASSGGETSNLAADPAFQLEKERLNALRLYRILDTPPEKEFDDLTFLAAHILKAPIATISLIDSTRQWFKSRIGLDAHETARDISFCTHAIHEDSIFEVHDASKDPRFQLNPFVTSAPRIRFYAGAPLVTPEGHRLGTICAMDRVPRKLDAEQRKALRSLSRQVVTQMELRRLNRQHDERNRELTLLRKMSNLLQSCVTSAEAYEVIRQYAYTLLPGSSGRVSLYANRRDVLESIVQWGDDAAGHSGFARVDCWALRLGRSHTILPGLRDMVCPHLMAGPPHELSVCVPLSAQSETIGLLSLACSQEVIGGWIAQEHAHLTWLAETLAEHLALSLTSIRMREVLREQSIRDPLTGLFNRRYMEETLERELWRESRRHSPLAVILFDLDHFKKVNDIFGHEMGDSVLQSFATVCQEHFRAEDVVCRYGGEEFLAVLPGVTLADVQIRVEDLRRKMMAQPMRWKIDKLPPMTFSAGIAIFDQHGRTGEELIRAADKALHKAKQQGRNCIVVAGERAQISVP